MMKYKFVVAGAANMSFCSVDADKKAYELGQEVVKQGGIIITGATTGVPYYAAKGAKEAGGISIGISPAASYAAHVKTYRLPVDQFDFIVYTGFDYSGRNLILTKSADAVIVGCGGFGTLNEFTVALEDRKPIGVFSGTGGVSDEIARIMEDIKDPHNHDAGRIIFGDDPKKIVSELIRLIDYDHKNVIVEAPTGE